MGTIFDRKTNKQDDQTLAELKRWWMRNPGASLLDLEAVAKDLGQRSNRRYPISVKRERPSIRA
jgi:hypothetical protein